MDEISKTNMGQWPKWELSALTYPINSNTLKHHWTEVKSRINNLQQFFKPKIQPNFCD